METGIRPPPPIAGGLSRSTPTNDPPPGAAKRAQPLAPTTGWATFDALQLVRPGRVLLVDAGCDAASRLLFSLLAGTVARGRDAIVIDGGNWLDVYRLGDAARLHGLKRDHVLASVRVARGFTAHQLQSLLEDALPQALSKGGLGLALASCLPEMYLDEDLAPSEARTLVARALRTLRDAARRHDIPVVVSNMTLSPRDRHRLRATLDEGVDASVALLPPGGPRATRRGASSSAMAQALRVLPSGAGAPLLDPGPRARQRLLGDFATSEAGPSGAFYRRAIDARIKYAPKHAGELKFKQRMQGEMTLSKTFGAAAAAPGGA